MPGLMSGDWKRSTVSGPQRLQPVRGQRRTYRLPRQPSTLTRPPSARPGRLVELAVDVDFGFLVIERQQVLNFGALRNRKRVTPHDVGEDLVADPGRPVRGVAFV